MSGFQRVINQQPSPAVQGDFASANPRTSIVPPLEAAFVAAAAQSVRVGFFAWGANDGKVYSSLAAGTIGGVVGALGFVARQPNIPSSIITTYLGESRTTLNDGLPVTLESSGDYWVALAGGNVGDIVYADATTGAPTLTDNSGANPDTKFKLASTAPVNAVTAGTSTIAVTTGILTIATVSSGVVEVGQRVTGTGVPDQTYITGQLTGTPGGAGTYQTSSRNRAAVAAFAATLVQGNMAKITRVAA